MGYGINVVSIVGNLTRDPELTYAGDLPIANLGVAVNGSEKKNGEWVDRADFFDVVVFGKRAANASEYLTKGSSVAISGRLRQDRWQNDAGENRTKVKIIAEQLKFLDTVSSESSQAGDAGPPDESHPTERPVAEESDIPF